MKTFYNKSLEDTYKELQTSSEGLTSQEAQSRLERDGENKLKEAKKTSIIVKFFRQFTDIMVIILMVAAVISLVVALIENTHEELIDACIIFAIVLLNATLGTVQEAKAENALESLKKMSQPYAKVMRDGKQIRIKTTELVVGDVVILEAGDVVPADMLLIESASLKCEEASLTGESVPSEKQAGIVLKDKTPIGDRKNMCFSSSTVAYGRGVGVVVATGQNAEIGKIASMLAQTKQDKTPLEHNLDKLGKIITVLVLAIAVVIFLVNIFVSKNGVLDAFLTAVAIAVAAIPESLSAVVTIILSIGVTRLAKKNVIIRRLHAVETLGCCEVICSDKTGTITQNKMTVRSVAYNKNIYSATELDEKNPVAVALLKCMTLCNDASKQDGGYIGDPTETALIEYAEGYKYTKSSLEKKFKRLGEIPFDSVRKLMSTANIEDDKVTVWTKGAVDELLKQCTYIYENGKRRKITEADKQAIMKNNEDLCAKALRVLGYAMSDGPSVEENGKIKSDKIKEKGLTFIGLTGMIDPPRDEVAEALKKCKQAGMRAVMITGDHKDTAYAIAKELGMIDNKKQVIEGAYLDNFTDEQLVSEINKYRVFTRVSPEHKVRIVKALKANGKVVAMTGDGVNDAPSIKNANIGIGMGITGTEVTKEVSDMVLTDDNFATIVVAVEEGRKIFGNIQKTIQFLLGCNIAEVLSIFVLTLLFPTYSFLLPVQILFINLISDSLPAIALGVEPAEKDVMSHPPRKMTDSIIGGKTGISIIYQGITQSVLVISAYLIGIYGYKNTEVAATMAFLVLNLVQLAHMFNVRTNSSILKSNPLKNKLVWLAFGVGVLLVLLISLVPFLETAFHVTTLTFVQWLVVVGLVLLIIPVCEIAKLIMRICGRKKESKLAAQEQETQTEVEVQE